MPTPLLPSAAGGCRTLLLLFICWNLIACGGRNDPPPAAASPRADSVTLESNSGSEISSFKRGPDDLVERLYQELVKKDSALTALEAQLQELPGKKRDSMQLFLSYDEKSQDYFRSAKGHIEKIKDSVLHKKMKDMIAASDRAYRDLTETHQSLISAVNEYESSLEDLHEMLKLTRTLPVLQRYEQYHVPTTLYLQKILGVYQETVDKEKELLKK